MARTKKRKPPHVEFPGAPATRALLRGVPWRVATGAAGVIPHICLAVLFAPALKVGLQSGAMMDAVSVGSAALAAIVLAFLAGLRRRSFTGVVLLASAAGVLMALVPVGTHAIFNAVRKGLELSPSPMTRAFLVYALAIFGGAWVFGLYLAALARFGLNHDQAFAALGHPGYKHFVRLRVRQDGSRIDAWAIGLVDPLAGDGPELIDHVTFWPSAPAPPGERHSQIV